MSPELYVAGKRILGFLGKYHAVIFLSLVGLVLAAGIYVMYLVIQTTFETPIVTTSTISDFDQKTIDSIKNLHDSTNSTVTVDLPSPRSNPFAE
ncbi:MAG: hypothetical protein JWO07_293 [Candidatus Saccharibacteria bacterium]|nr:hypothetical protein [Candidatus Saccharibacteria bacterium]